MAERKLIEDTPPLSRTSKKSCLHLENLNKALIILLWHVGTGLIYNLLLSPVVHISWVTDTSSIVNTGTLAVFFLVLTPVASFVADVKSTRFKTLMRSTYCIIISSIIVLLSGIVLGFSVRSFNAVYYTSISFLIGSVVFYLCGRIFFQANVLQFGTDQLRDAPSRYSVLFIYAYYWCDTVSSVFTSSTNTPGHNITINNRNKIIVFDKQRVISFIVVVFSSILLSLISVLIVHKKQHCFNTEKIRGNPYRLTWRVLKFAIQHNKPIKRSAFTFYENIVPTRLDFGKQRYGGPFTTEQVEDVKVLLNLMKIIVLICPFFFMDLSATMIVNHHRVHNTSDSTNNFWKVFLIYNNLLSPVGSVIWIPILYKLSLTKWLPNIFKRIGLSILLTCSVFIIYLIYDIIGNKNSNDLIHMALICNTTDKFKETPHYVQFSSSIVIVIHSVLSSLYMSIVYTSVCELICSQSPQFMKGFVFSVFYTVQAFSRFLAAVILYIIYMKYKSHRYCSLLLYIIYLCIGILVLITYSIKARKYQYRKRDDICNIYQYAEDYYFKEPRNN